METEVWESVDQNLIRLVTLLPPGDGGASSGSLVAGSGSRRGVDLALSKLKLAETAFLT